MPYRGPGFVDHHVHLLQVASGAFRMGSDPYTPGPIRHDPDFALVTAAHHRRVAEAHLTPMDWPPMPVRAIDLPGALDAGLREAARAGLVQITEAGLPEWKYLDALLELREHGPLPVRVRLLIASGIATPERMTRVGDPWLEVIGVKFYADGWLVPHTCALSCGFIDRRDDDGILFMDGDALARRATPFADTGWTIATHAIGDRAIEAVVDAYEAIYGSDCPAAAPRIEHAQVLREDLIARMAELGIVACIQPSFAVADAPYLGALGPLGELAYRWDLLLAAGVPVITGSDFPVETLSPLWGLRRLVTGTDVNGGGDAGRRIGLEDALALMTDPAAGSVVLSEDPRTVEPTALHRIGVLLTEPSGVPPPQGPASFTQSAC